MSDSAAAGASDLASATAVTPLPKAPGWYTAHLDHAWDFATPSGGVLMTVAMRAMQIELDDPGLRPVSANTLFMSPVPAGSLEIRVEVLRRGGAAAQLRAGLSSTDIPGPGLEVSATFARDRTGPEFTDTTFPPALDVEASPRRPNRILVSRDFQPAFFANFEVRHALGPQWWADSFEPGDARVARWFRYLRPQLREDGTFDPLALPPICDTMPPAARAKLGPEPEWYAPSLDLTVHFLETTRDDWLLVSAHSRKAHAGYATADVEVWDTTRHLVAYATQTMLFRSPPEISP